MCHASAMWLHKLSTSTRPPGTAGFPRAAGSLPPRVELRAQYARARPWPCRWKPATQPEARRRGTQCGEHEGRRTAALPARKLQHRKYKGETHSHLNRVIQCPASPGYSSNGSVSSRGALSETGMYVWNCMAPLVCPKHTEVSIGS